MFKKFFSRFETVPAKVTVDGNSRRTTVEMRVFGGEPFIRMEELPAYIQEAVDWKIECFIEGRFWTIEGGCGEVYDFYFEEFPGIDNRTKVFGRA